MISDQTFLDEDLAALDAHLRGDETIAAFLRLESFDARLTSYVRGEELVLFPVLERFVDVPRGTTAKMRSEHRRLRRLLDNLWQTLARQDLRGGIDALGELRSVLLLHCEKEERVLAPLLRLTTVDEPALD